MSRPRLLDLFCCAGGASKGYADAGFDVYGVDIGTWSDATQSWNLGPLRRYPFAYHHGDAINVMARLVAGLGIDFIRPDGATETLHLSDFAAVAGSPPCQAYSITKHSHDKEHPQLIEPTRDLMRATGLPYVIENVVGAPLIQPLMLCGSEFGLTAIDRDGTRLRLERHRLFESDLFLVGAGGCHHNRHIQVAGAYGGGSVDRSHAKNVRRGGYTPATEVRAALLGIDWMTQGQLSQSIPPAYTRHIGEQLLAHLESESAA